MSDSDKLELGMKRAKDLGLNRGPFSSSELYLANDIHRLLSEGVESTCEKNGIVWTSYSGPPSSTGTHFGLLIGLRPIIQESEEKKLLREIVKYNTCIITGTPVFPSSDWIERAKRLLRETK